MSREFGHEAIEHGPDSCAGQSEEQMNKNTARFLLALIGVVLATLSALVVWWFPIFVIAIGLFGWLVTYLINKALS